LRVRFRFTFHPNLPQYQKGHFKHLKVQNDEVSTHFGVKNIVQQLGTARSAFGGVKEVLIFVKI
jgi:hypothetical protein